MTPLRLIIVDDSADDAELLMINLREAGFDLDCQRVEREEDFVAALKTQPQLVLCDYGLPQFSTRRALELVKQTAPDTPFIIVSGYIGEDAAVAMLKAGASDYLLKGSLARLDVAVQRELRDAETRRDQRRLEDALRVVAEAVVGPTGKAFLDSLVIQLAKVTGAAYVFIGEFRGPGGLLIETVCACRDGKIVGNVQYGVADLPVDPAPSQQIVTLNRGLDEYPLMTRLGFCSYMGATLLSSVGDRLGLLAIMHTASIANVQTAEALLQIYSARAAGELERMAQTEALKYQATHDTLTALENRHALQMRMSEIVTSGALQSGGALFLIDLDHFKEVNNTLGHHSGDAILRQIGPRLSELLGGDDMLCRFGGDEFAVLAPGLHQLEAVEQLAMTLLYAIREPFNVDGIHLRIGASIGIAIYPQHGDSIHQILRRADVAMYLAKQDGSGYQIYDPRQDLHTTARLTLMTELRQAIESDELVMHYQPKFNLQARRQITVEALVRWQHPQRGLLLPAEFVPVAELTDLIGPLTVWVVDAAVQQCRRWRDEGYMVKVSVNISTRNLLDDQLPQRIQQMVCQHDVSPECLEFEITESAIMADPGRSLDVLRRISAMGHELSIDDFGTGYSSLAYLTKLPVQNLKIDRTFVRQMIRSPRDASIVQSTIGLAHNLGMRVIAEGVEDRETLDKLRRLGCDEAQGYLIGRPVCAADIVPLLRAFNRVPVEA